MVKKITYDLVTIKLRNGKKKLIAREKPIMSKQVRNFRVVRTAPNKCIRNALTQQDAETLRAKLNKNKKRKLYSMQQNNNISKTLIQRLINE